MAKKADVKVNVTAETKQASEALKNISFQVERIVSKQNNLTSKAAAVTSWGAAYMLVSNAVKKVAADVSELISAYSLQQTAETKLQATIKATGNVIGVSTTELYSMAEALSRSTTFTDQTVLSMQQVIIASGRISREALPKVTELALDMATAMGIDGTQAARDLSKALANPIEGLSQLKEKNINFTASEQTKVAELAKTNKMFEAQQLILDKIEKTYGGIAREVASTDIGKITQIQNLMTDIKEGLGEAIVNRLAPVFTWLLEKLGEVKTLISDMNDSLDATDAVRNSYFENQNQMWPLSGVSDHHLLSFLQDKNKKADYETWQRQLEKFNVDPVTADASQLNVLGGNAKLFRMYRTAENEARRRAYNIDSSLAPFMPVDTALSTISAQQSNNFIPIPGNTPDQTITAVKTLNDYIKENISLSKTAQAQLLAANITTAESWLAQAEAGSQEKSVIEEILAGLKKQQEELQKVPDSVSPFAAVDSYIAGNKGLSKSAQLRELDKSLADVRSLQESVPKNSQRYNELEEIRQALVKERQELNNVAAAEKAAEEAATKRAELRKSFVDDWVSSVASMIDTLSSLTSQLYQNQINALQASLDAQVEAWDKHYAKLKEKYDDDKDALDAQYRWGRISAEEYHESLKALEDKQVVAEKDAAAKKEEIADKLDELKRKQFESEKSNSIAQALIGGAMSIVEIWAKYASQPWYAGALTALSAGTVAAQVATIGSQQYTGLAAGGIITRPTYLMGEADKEMVLPLNKAKDLGFVGNQEGVINLTVNVGTVLSGEDLSRHVYDGIRKAQKTGALPQWGIV